MSTTLEWCRRVLRGFGRFWWDFLVGDTPEIFVAVIAVVGIVALISVGDHANGAAVVVLPGLALATLGGSLWRARRRARK